MKPYFKIFLIFFLINFLIVSCSKNKVAETDSSKNKNATSEKKVQPLFPQILKVKNKQMFASLQNGQKLYFQYCSDCHGQEGKGDGDKGLGLNPRPKDETNYKIMKKLADWYLFKITKEGGLAVNKSAFMPAYKNKLKDKEIKDIVNFIKMFSRK